MPSVPFMSSLFPHNYSLKVSSSRPQQPRQRRPDLHPLQKRIDDPEPSFTDLVLALPLPPSLPSSNAASPTSAMFENSAAMKSAPSLQLNTRASSSGGYRRPSAAEQQTHLPTPPRALSKARSGSDLRSRASAQRTASLTPRQRTRSSRPSTPTRDRSDTVTFDSCMESGTAYEAQAHEAGNQGVLAARHLRIASNLFGQALAMRPHSAWARLRRATMLLLLARLEDPPTAISLATAQLQESRSDLLHLSRCAPGSMTVRETLATVSGELSKVHLSDSSDGDGPAGRLALEALECMEEVAAERMDRAAQLARAEFGPQTPALAAMFLHLAETAGAAAVLSPDSGGVEEFAELAEKALDQATNMVGLATTMLPPSPDTTALITRVQLASGRLSVDRLRHLAVLGEPFHESDFTGALRDLTLLADETKERATTSTVAAMQAYECARLLGDTLWLVACLMRGHWGDPLPPIATTTSVPCSAHAQPTPEGYVYSRSRAGSVGPSARGSDGSLPVLDRSRQSSTTSIGSLESPPIAEEVIIEEDDAVSPSWAAGGGTKPTSPSTFPALAPKLSPTRPPTLPEPAQTPKGRRRPPPLQLSLPPPVCPLPPVPSPLSPLNPAHPRRASETRPRVVRQFSGTLPSGSVPRRASSGSARLSPNSIAPLSAMSAISAPAHPHAHPHTAPVSPLERNPVPPARTLELARRAIEHLESAEARYQQSLACLPDGHARERAEVLLQLAAVNLFKAAVPRSLLQALGTERRGSYLISAEVYANKALEAITPKELKVGDRLSGEPRPERGSGSHLAPLTPAEAAERRESRESATSSLSAPSRRASRESDGRRESGSSGRVSPSPAAAEWLDLDGSRLEKVHWRTQAVARLALLTLLEAQHVAGKEADVARLLTRMRGRVTMADVKRYLAAGAHGSSAGQAVSAMGEVKPGAFWGKVREALAPGHQHDRL